MSQKLTVLDLKAPSSRIAAALNICADDERFMAWLNEAEERMLNQGRWLGSVQEAQFCITNNCVVFPREIAIVEKAKLCGYPIDTVNGWSSYTRMVANPQPCSACSRCSGSDMFCAEGHLQLHIKEAGAASFSTTLGVNKKIRSYVGHASDVGKKIIYQGTDKNGVWVRTLIGGVMSDGEQVTLASPFVDTTTIWGPGAPTAVIKDATVQRVLVYELNTDTSAERQIATYEPDETRPLYRVGYLPHANSIHCGCTINGTNTKTLTCQVSLQHVPLVSDNDWLILQNPSAYKSAMIAMKAYEDGEAAKGDYYFYGSSAPSRNARGVVRVVNRGGAIPLLQAELRKATGDRTNAYVRLDESASSVREMLGFI